MRQLIITLLLMLPLAVQAADPVAEDIDSFVKHAMEAAPDVPGLGIAVVRDGKPYFVRGYGLRDVEKNLKADENTVFYIASSTKSYMGLLAAVLANRGVVDLDAPITRYLTEVKFTPEINAEHVTLRALLSHTSGIKNDAIVSRTAFTGEHTPAMLVSLLNRSTAIEPKYQYDNLGYVVTGLVLERVTGKKWQDLLQTEIFKPLGMTHTSAYMSKAAGWPVATPYDVDSTLQRHKMTLLKSDATMHAAGGIVTTPLDLAKWLAANINRKGLPAAAFDEAQKQQTPIDRTVSRFKASGYGFGWNLADYEGSKVLFHMGGYEGWRAHVSFMPDAKIGVAIVTNTSGFGAPIRDVIATYIYDRLRGVNRDYEPVLETFKSDRQKMMDRVKADAEKRSKRAPTLLHDPAAYVGVYSGDAYGKLTIIRTTDGLHASLGQLSAKLEPFTEPETARVELIPGTGEVLRFVINGDQVEAVKYNDETFKRVIPMR